MNIFFNKCIFFIFIDISDISVKSKYQYICNYRYFVPWFKNPKNVIMSTLLILINNILNILTINNLINEFQNFYKI